MPQRLSDKEKSLLLSLGSAHLPGAGTANLQRLQPSVNPDKSSPAVIILLSKVLLQLIHTRFAANIQYQEV